MITDKKIPNKLERIAERYVPYCFEPIAEVLVDYAQTREHFRDLPSRSDGLTWKRARRGTRWGGPWVSAWFRGRVKLPSGCRGRRVFVRASTGAHEALFLVDGEHRGAFDAEHPVVMMTGRGVAGRSYQIAIEAHAGSPCVGTQPGDTWTSDFKHTFEKVEVLLPRNDVIAFVFDLKVLLQLAGALDENSLRRNRILAGLSDVHRLVAAMPDERPEENWRNALAEARPLMRPLLAARNGDTAPFIGVIGHSHIDTAWLWTLAEAERKCARTFSSMLNLMEQYPDFVFLQSAPYHTDVVRRKYPGIFRRIMKRVAEGRWEPNGAAWIEMDCNIPSGESFVRQFLLGQAATQKWFGYKSDTFWQPDVFGYSAALPQILRSCGVEFFLTTKISENDTTRFPHDTFHWQGIDGSTVLAHFNEIHCWPDPKTLAAQWQNVQHKDVQDRRLSAIGFGDGGGGPQYEMFEFAQRVKDLEGCPRTAYTTLSDFMRGVRDELRNLPTWVGELYLELHRGTLTSIAGVKRANRQAEIALRDAEFVWTLAALSGRRYPGKRLLEQWKVLLLNQFHDILPGSSIPQVNDQSIEELNGCVKAVRALTGEGLKAIGGRSSPSTCQVLNTLSWDRGGELVLHNVGPGLVPASSELICQRVKDVQGRDLLVVDGLKVPALGASTLELKRGRRRGRSPFSVGPHTVQTPHARVRFDRAGRIVSFVDKRSGRQLVKTGGAFNTFWIGEDVPEAWDNWDIDFDQRFKMAAEQRLISRKVVTDGPLQLRLRSEYKLGDASHLVQDMVFHATTARVDFETVVQWSELHKLLKTGFTIDVLSDRARHEIQYGHVERPTHRNQMPDRAQFEVSNHKWTDLSENRFGVALLNDSKYGISVDGSDVRLTLLKSGRAPDPRGDPGTHVFAYALLPHDGGFSAQTVVRPAYEFNIAPLVRPGAKGAVESLLRVDAPNVIVEAIKWSEDGEGFIVRLYETERSGTDATIEFGPAAATVSETNMLEEDGRPLKLTANRVRARFRPFEIKTLRVELGSESNPPPS